MNEINYNNFQYEASYGTSSQLPVSDIPEIAFSGRSNVGKSTLLNKLCSRKNLARVSSSPGKTTTVNFFRAADVRFADLPGYGFAKRGDNEKLRWASLMESYFNSDRSIKLVVQLIDCRRPPTEDDMVMFDFMRKSGCPFIVVMTKWDKLNKTQAGERLENITSELPFLDKKSIFPFSALNNTGTEEIKKAINNYIL